MAAEFMDKPVILVVGARPNFMKIAPLYAELMERGVNQLLLHTGQHYDQNMSQVFFDDLGIPKPDVYLGVGSGSHASQTAKVMVEFEKTCIQHDPSLVVVVGDVNSTVACSMVCAKLMIPCAHVEAGLRSFDRQMPEEINRIVTDSLCDILLTPSRDADENLKKEGVESNRIHLVGNIMIDTLQRNVQKASNKRVAESFGLERGKYAVVTLHRPSNVDNRDVIEGILNALGNISQEIPLIFPAHPRTSKMISALGLEGLIEKFDKLIFTDPMGYLDFLSLVSQSKMVLTDSGGLQEETTALGIPCLTLRDNTERPITVSEGTNTIVGNLPESIITAANEVILTGGKSGRVPELWDGNTAFRIAGIIEETIASTI